VTNFLDPEFEAPVERDGFRSRRARLGREAGCEHLGISLFELEPGSAAFPLHYHLGNEEMLIALGDGLALRTADGERALAAGEVVALRVGEAGAHQVVNRGDDPARLLMVSEMNAPDIVIRLDSQKVSAAGYPPGQLVDGYHEIFHRRDAAGFWDGEPPPPPANP
jgi:uncharacterized cupin superfamily protein